MKTPLMNRYYMAMTTCEDGVDTSYMKREKAKMLCEAIGCTDVGLIRDRLDMQLNQCMLAELVESPGLEVPGGFDPARDDHPGEDVEESIFDDGSKLGLLPYIEGDYWVHDKAASSWTRVIVVPRREFYHPSEGLERSVTTGPVLANLRDLRLTITSLGKVVKDNWRKAGVQGGPTDDSED